MFTKYIYKDHKIIRFIWILYSVLFPFFAKCVFTSVSTYELLADLCIFNFILLIIGFIYMVFCIKNNYYFDVLVTAVTQFPLSWYSLGMLLAIGLLLGGQR